MATNQEIQTALHIVCNPDEHLAELRAMYPTLPDEALDQYLKDDIVLAHWVLDEDDAMLDDWDSTPNTAWLEGLEIKP